MAKIELYRKYSMCSVIKKILKPCIFVSVQLNISAPLWFWVWSDLLNYWIFKYLCKIVQESPFSFLFKPFLFIFRKCKFVVWYLEFISHVSLVFRVFDNFLFLLLCPSDSFGKLIFSKCYFVPGHTYNLGQNCTLKPHVWFYWMTDRNIWYHTIPILLNGSAKDWNLNNLNRKITFTTEL